MSSPYHRFHDQSDDAGLSIGDYHSLNGPVATAAAATSSKLFHRPTVRRPSDAISDSDGDQCSVISSVAGDTNDSEDGYDNDSGIEHAGHGAAPTPRHGALHHGDWSDGLFDCLDGAQVCLMSLVAPCMRFALTLSRLRMLSFPLALALYGVPFCAYISLYVYLNVAFPNTFGTEAQTDYSTVYLVLLIVMLVLHSATMVVGAVYRAKIRHRYEIPGNGAEDFILHCCCTCCTIAQEARHVDRDLAISV